MAPVHHAQCVCVISSFANFKRVYLKNLMDMEIASMISQRAEPANVEESLREYWSLS
jgi:hypothetical protein